MLRMRTWDLRGSCRRHQRPAFRDPEWDRRDDPVPAWVIVIHACFMSWTIMNAHHPALFMFGLLFFLGFAHVTSPYQNVVDLKAPLLVGFFHRRSGHSRRCAGLVDRPGARQSRRKFPLLLVHHRIDGL